MDLKYLISMGGAVEGVDSVPEEAKPCIEQFMQCEGDGPCMGRLEKTLIHECLGKGKPYKEHSVKVSPSSFLVKRKQNKAIKSTI